MCNPTTRWRGSRARSSAQPGDDVALFINTTASAVQTQVYRMGYYQGLGGRLFLQTDFVAAGAQPAPVVNSAGTVSCPWKPTMTLSITKDWLPGCYLLKLVGSGGEEQFVPLTIRDDASTAAYVIQNSVTTWQAYNLWGNYSLYYGQNGAGKSDFANRARIVSFDRPYPQTWASGAADFVGNELPLLFHLESLGLDLTYWTDVDLHARPELLMNHRCLFSLGHDEYWSQPMRQGAAQANAAGVNLAFLGANACYRQIRMQPSSVGPNRLQVCYKDAAEDPLAQTEPSLTTVNWNQSPLDQPESTLIGSMYQSVGAKADTVVTDASSWFYDGCNLTDGQAFPNTILGEYDRYVPSLPGPKNADVLAHSPVPGSVQLVRHHLLHRAGERWWCVRQRIGQLRLAAVDDRRHPLASSFRARSPASATSSVAPWRTSTGASGWVPPPRTARRAATGPRSTPGRRRRPGARPAPRRPEPRRTAPTPRAASQDRGDHTVDDTTFEPRPPTIVDRPMGKTDDYRSARAASARLGCAGHRRTRRPGAERMLLRPGAARFGHGQGQADHDHDRCPEAGLPPHRACPRRGAWCPNDRPWR